MAGTGLFETLLTAALVFASTNVDDIVLLSVLFADPQLPARTVVTGQFLGIGALVLVSALAGLAAVAVPPEWTALLGVVPLAIGLFKLVGVVRAQAPKQKPRAENHFDGSAIGAVAGVTIANGADNLSVYIPLFAANRAAIVVYAGVFAVLTGVWCWLGHRLVSNQLVGAKLRRYSHIVLPIVLIGIGFHILLGARELLH